mmetsp:Transcript_62695/g.117290  ORF Transcript_62695/g.117290 Transcript_62695/m.117290 type:complete len:83 (-) Transcript_62695:342-590(-)
MLPSNPTSQCQVPFRSHFGGANFNDLLVIRGAETCLVPDICVIFSMCHPLDRHSFNSVFPNLLRPISSRNKNASTSRGTQGT